MAVTVLSFADGGATRAGAVEAPLEHLAGRVARQLVHEQDLAGHLEAGEVALDVVLHRLLVQAGARAQHHEGAQALAELLVADADDRDLFDLLVARRAGPRPRAGRRSRRR